MKFRPHRGSLSDAMKEVSEIEPSMETLKQLLILSDEKLEIKYYCYDERIDWDTYIVVVNGQTVGFTDGPVE